jgi:hypothetical protein
MLGGRYVNRRVLGGMLHWRHQLATSGLSRRRGAMAVGLTASLRRNADGQAAAAVDPAVSFNKDFIVSQIDYHMLLLDEANRKHCVPLNVPPQLNPPTDEHKPVFTDALGAKMQEPERHFGFAPLHGPPPRLPEMEPKVVKRALPPPAAKPAPATATAGNKMFEDAKPFKCNLCNKQFRMKLAAEQHIESQHAGDATAKIIETPSPDATKKGTATETTKAAETSTPVAASKTSSLSAGPNPLVELMANMLPLAGDVAVGLEIPTEPPVIFTLPTDDEIDALLLDTWDPVAKKTFGDAFKPTATFVVSDTDAEVAQRNAAAGLDSFAAVVGKVKDAETKNAAGGGGAPSGNALAAHAARTGLQTGGFASPFVNANNYNTPMPTTHTTTRLERKFKCDLCPKTFRLFDAVVNHYQVAHDCEPSDAKIAEFKALDNPHVPALQVAAASEAAHAAAAASSDAQAVAAAMSTDGAKEVKPPIPVVDLAAHIRAGSNMVLMGQVREVRFGFVKADPVAQLLVQVDTPRQNAAAPDEVETEYFTVRCFGEQYSDLLKPSLEAGSTVLIHGTLKLNFHLDTDSGETFPYPYVKVVPPYGDVVQLQA